jgi:ABC-type bacteriocin/lantibiotic exporter with double-glycine peptidase domain
MSHLFIKLPIITQCNESSCGVACVQSILSHYNIGTYQEELYSKLKLDKENGIEIKNIIKFFKTNNFDVHVKTNTSINDIKQFLKNKIPVLTVFQAWKSDNIKSWSSIWDCGHYSVIIGIDNNNIYMMDPMIIGSYGYIPIDEFEERWHDIDVHKHIFNRFSCAVYNANPKIHRKFKKIN